MPHPHNHLHPANPAAAAPDNDWQAWSQAWTRHIPVLTGLSDLTVVVAPGAGGGAPACTYPDLRRIEVDAAYIGSPDIANPKRASHRKIVPTAYGLLVHEAAHATHSLWRTPAGTPPVVAHIADMLEESRAEGRHRQRRKGDRRWLRHTVTTLLSPHDAPVDDVWHAATLAGLLLARVDARIIASRDVRVTKAAVTTILGRQRLNQLRELWCEAHTTADTDATTMIDLAWKWCQILGIDPHTHPHPPETDLGVFPGTLADALTILLAAAAGMPAAAYTARHVHTHHGAPARWIRREPTDEERHAARTLAERLHRARTHTTEPGTRPATAPPGRLRTRQAITADAQIASGAMATVEPWQRRTHLPPHKPPLHLAILVDLSGSMSSYTKPMSSAAWVFSHAAHRNNAAVAVLGFADTVTLIATPKQSQPTVLEMQTNGGTSTFIAAVKVADTLLNLRHRHAIRMLAVVSDGELYDIEPSQRLISTLHRSGCAVLWLRPEDLYGHTFADTTTILVTDPVTAVDHIADAAVAALDRA